MSHPIKKLTIYILAFCICQTCLANNPLKFEPIAKKDYPALVFMEEDVNPNTRFVVGNSLYIAAVKDGKVNCRKIISSQYVQATQIGDSVFLVEASEHPVDYEKWSQKIYLVDFSSGSSILLSESISRDKLVHIKRIHSDLNRNKAVIIRYGQGTENQQLFEVDLKTLEQKLLYTIPNNIHLGPQEKLSPDFTHFALPPSSYDFKTFTLSIIDMKTMTISVLDKNINVLISGGSSQIGSVPYEWVSNNEILYQDMLPPKEGPRSFMSGTYILKSINIETRKTTEWVRQEMQLTGDGGSLKLNPFTGNIEYMDGKYIVDIKNHSLIPQKPNFSIVQRFEKPSDIYYNDKLIYNGICTPFSCISHSSDDFAFSSKPEINSKQYVLQLVINGNEKLIPIKEVSFYTHPICWIEDTSSLRTKSN